MPSEHLLSNSANAPLQDLAADDARLALAPLQPRRAAVLDSMQSFQVRDDEDLRRAADKIALAKALVEASDRALEPIGGPYREASHAVRNVALNFSDALNDAVRRANEAIDAFRRRQREAAAKAKTDQAERERQLRMEAGLDVFPAAGPVKAADVKLAPVRSDYRANVHDRKVTRVSIVNARELPDTILQAPQVVKALESAVRMMAKLTTEIPGANIEFDQASSVKVK